MKLTTKYEYGYNEYKPRSALIYLTSSGFITMCKTGFHSFGSITSFQCLILWTEIPGCSSGMSGQMLTASKKLPFLLY
ncbi:protein of unknown function [Citrobacter amalonaticus]|nr:protein of unknown function [Citrobacter amalonaticus]